MRDPLEVLVLPAEPVDPGIECTRRVLSEVGTALRAARPVRVAVSSHTEGVEMSATTTATATDYDTLDEALGILQGTGPEFDPWGAGFCLTNHAPMIAEALCAAGRPDAVVPWVERYRRYLDATPPRRTPIEDWRGALGRLDRFGDWDELFVAELDTDAWDVVVNRWVPRLAPATVAVHGVLRAAHAIRGIGNRDTALRRRDLASSLAYWAAVYETMPTTARPSNGLRPSEALPRLEQIPVADRTSWMLFTEPLARVVALEASADVADLVAVDGDPSAFLSDLTQAMAAMLVSNPARARGIVHAYTAGTATRMMLPHLSPEATATSLRYGWQVAAAFYAGFAVRPLAVDVDAPDTNFDELLDEALTCPDEHAIKITEACLREDRITPHPVYLAAAQACTRELMVTGLRLP